MHCFEFFDLKWQNNASLSLEFIRLEPQKAKYKIFYLILMPIKPII